ncbi:tetratricopeptide repeat protein [Sphingopyxis panaciterrae]
MEVFGSGPGLEEPRGDAGRQAVAALRGYAYQIYISAIAWLGLADQEMLVLEVAEDFAVASADALAGTQVKATAGNITLQSSDTRATIDSFVDLVARNPTRTVSIHHLTTSGIGAEQRLEHRINGGPALYYWRSAAAGADVAPLRALISGLALNPVTHDFLASLSDEGFRTSFLARIHWHCGAPGLQDVRTELEAGLIEYVSTARGLSSRLGRDLVPLVVERVFLKAVSAEARHLRRADLLTLIDEASRISVPIDQLSTAFGGGSGGLIRPSLLLSASELALPVPRAPRTPLVAAIDGRRRASGVVCAVGASGLGKSLVARLVADDAGSPWAIVDFHNLNAADTAARLALLPGELVAGPPTGLILDDLNEMDDPRVRDLLARVLANLRRRDATAIITAYRSPAPTTLHALCAGGLPVVDIPYLEEDEVADLVSQAGGDPKYAGHIFREATGGHPQLAMALIQTLSQTEWSRTSLAKTLGQGGGDGLKFERRAARQRLMAALPTETSTLLMRASLIGGGFDRGMALTLGEIAPAVSLAGNSLDRLIGAWIEVLPQERLRVSPLIEGAAVEVLSEAECQAIHSRIADRILSQSGISVFDVDLLTRHSLQSGEASYAAALANAVLTSSEDMLETLASFTGTLQRLDCSKPILPGEFATSAMLRLAQLLLLVQKGTAEQVRACWDALQVERTRLAGPVLFESLLYSKLLIQSRASMLFPEWADLLVYFDRLVIESPELAAASENFGAMNQDMPHVTGVMLASQMPGFVTVGAFRGFMTRIDRETPEFRERCFSGFRPGRADISILVNHGWLKESRSGDFDWERAAADYSACADLAMKWGNRALAARCAIAQAICIDENGDDKDRALTSLLDAEQRFGFDIALPRARAKIHWRRRDHAAALPLLTVAAETGGQDPLERAYIAREAGVSAAALGDWEAARSWFEKAREAALLLDQAPVRAMAIGLLADIGHAAALTGNMPLALEKLREALLALPSIDPDGTLSEAYCHRVVRHGALWLSIHVTERKAPEDAGIIFEAGTGSNTEPLELIRSHPLAPLDFGFYLLAEVDRALPVPTGYHERFRDDLFEGPILQTEASLAIGIANDMIVRHDATGFVRQLREIASLTGYFEKLRKQDPDARGYSPERGRVPEAVLDGDVNQDILSSAEDFLLTFAIASVLDGDFFAFEAAVDVCLAAPEVAALRPLLVRMRGDTREFTKEREAIAITINGLRSDARGSAEEHVWGGIWLLLHARATKWADVVVPQIVAWIFDQWEEVLRNWRFTLSMPALNAPAIEAILADPDRSLGAAARLTLAAVPAAGTVIGQQLLPILTELAEQHSSAA